MKLSIEKGRIRLECNMCKYVYYWDIHLLDYTGRPYCANCFENRPFKKRERQRLYEEFERYMNE